MLIFAHARIRGDWHMQLILVRHGATDVGAGLCIGRTDPPLSVRGFTDVQRLAASWNERSPRFLFSSDLRRAEQSAQVFAARFAIEPLLDARLREVDFGRWDGRAWSDIVADDVDRYRHWLDNWVIQEAPEGESFADVLRRTGAWLAALLGATLEDDVVLAIAHAGSIRAVLCHALGLPAHRATALGIDECRAVRIHCRGGQFEVRSMNTERFETN